LDGPAISKLVASKNQSHRLVPAAYTYFSEEQTLLMFWAIVHLCALVPALSGKVCSADLLPNVCFSGSNDTFKKVNCTTATECCEACMRSGPECVAFKLDLRKGYHCDLKRTLTNKPQNSSKCTSGIMHRAPTPPSPAPPDWLPIVQKRVLLSLLPDSSAESEEAIDIATHWSALLSANGTFPDLDYSERKPAGWPLIQHLNRVTSMASAWACTTCNITYQQAPLLKSAENGLRYWLGSDPKNPNWYQNDIAVPREIGKIGVLLRAVLSSTDVEKMVMLLKRSTPEKWTGANAMDGYRIQVYRGVLADDRSLVEDALKQTYAAVKYFPQKDDSFQLDHSFHQHGPQLLPAVYGAVIASNTMALAAWAEGTSIAMSTASFAVFEGYVLDGLVWYAAGTATSAVWDWQVAGRRITVPYLESEWKWRPAFSLKGSLRWPRVHGGAFALHRPRACWDALARRA
jgi:hypothetical protein